MSAQKKRILNFENPNDNPDEKEKVHYVDHTNTPFENLKDEISSDKVFDFSHLEADDRRKEERIPNTCTAIIYNGDQILAKVRMKDVSYSGLGFISFDPNLPLNTGLKIEINGNNILPSLLFDFEIVTKYLVDETPNSDTGYGCLITKMSKLTYKKFQQFLEYRP